MMPAMLPIAPPITAPPNPPIHDIRTLPLLAPNPLTKIPASILSAISINAQPANVLRSAQPEIEEKSVAIAKMTKPSQARNVPGKPNKVEAAPKIMSKVMNSLSTGIQSTTVTPPDKRRLPRDETQTPIEISKSALSPQCHHTGHGGFTKLLRSVGTDMFSVDPCHHCILSFPLKLVAVEF